MGTTKVGPQQTAGEVVSELVKAGATSINTDYKNGKISGIRWIMRVGSSQVLFDMPIRIEPVLKKIGDRDQAERTAWRQLLRWVQAGPECHDRYGHGSSWGGLLGVHGQSGD